ncbi:MAG: hypothetical protein JNM80_01330 [Phycisphaerae bacterium]|nr:hypothetical protein [Phycisphaerae bacterium]
MDTRRTAWRAGCLIVLAGLATPALGQRALDANQRVGDGRINPEGRDFGAEVRFRNAIITGNAPGGLSFRGDVGYRAPGEFLGTQGSNDLFAFRRDSASSGLAGMGIRGTDALQYQFAMTTGSAPPKGLVGAGFVTRAGGGLPTGAIREGQIAPGAAEGRGSGFISSPPREGGTALSALRSPSAFVADRGLQPQLLATWEKEGTRYGLSASPLRGVVAAPMGEFGLKKESKPESKPPRPGSLETGAIKPSVPESTLEPSRSPFEDLLERWGGAKKAGTPDGRPGTGEPGQTEPGKTEPGAGAAGDVAGWRDTLARLKGELAEEDRPRVKRAPERRPGDLPKQALPTRPGDEGKSTDNGSDGKGGTSGKGSEEKDAEGTRSRREAIELIRSLGELGPLTTMTPKGFDAYAEHMAEGEKHMASSRYFDAEERFTAALSSKPIDPMAAMGRVHAQLGAGVFISAAMNLRDALTKHPETMGVRYAPGLLPRPGRIVTIVERLDDLIKHEPERSRDAGLLLAYIGYQTQQPALVDRGLRAARALPSGAPEDQMSRLSDVLREVWAKKKENP